MSMDAFECPHCSTEFVGSIDDESDYDDADAALVTCPICMKAFDPYATPKTKREDVKIDELFDVTKEEEIDEELD